MALANGCIQVYTGDGKGKTTAALGLALRAAGAGLRVFFAQFAKGMETSELAALGRLSDLIEVRRFGLPRFIVGSPSAEDREAARQGLAETRRAIESGDFDVVVLDEANVAASIGLFSIDDLLALADLTAGRIELVITGRGADPRIIARADLVTEMREIKHYFARGVCARKGIEL